MDQDEYEKQLNDMKNEAMRTFDVKCKSPYRLEGSKRTTIKDDFVTKLEGHMKDFLKRHEDFINKNGVRVIYNGRMMRESARTAKLINDCCTVGYDRANHE